MAVLHTFYVVVCKTFAFITFILTLFSDTFKELWAEFWENVEECELFVYCI